MRICTKPKICLTINLTLEVNICLLIFMPHLNHKLLKLEECQEQKELLHLSRATDSRIPITHNRSTSLGECLMLGKVHLI